MSKAVLVIDMPESCSKCKFLYEFQGIKKCQLMNVLNGGASRLSQNSFTISRHENCPLVPMPKQKPVRAMGEWLDFNCGWNAAIDAIGGNDSDGK